MNCADEMNLFRRSRLLGRQSCAATESWSFRRRRGVVAKAAGEIVVVGEGDLDWEAGIRTPIDLNVCPGVNLLVKSCRVNCSPLPSRSLLKRIMSPLLRAGAGRRLQADVQLGKFGYAEPRVGFEPVSPFDALQLADCSLPGMP